MHLNACACRCPQCFGIFRIDIFRWRDGVGIGALDDVEKGGPLACLRASHEVFEVSFSPGRDGIRKSSSPVVAESDALDLDPARFGALWVARQPKVESRSLVHRDFSLHILVAREGSVGAGFKGASGHVVGFGGMKSNPNASDPDHFERVSQLSLRIVRG